MSERFSIGPVQRLNLALSAGATAASWALVSPRFAGSLALGALLEAVNFRSLRRACEIFVSGEPKGGGAVLAGFGARFTLLGVAMGVALYAGAHPVGLVVGLSMIVPAAIASAWTVRPVDSESAPSLSPDDPAWDRWNPWLARENEDEEEGDW